MINFTMTTLLLPLIQILFLYLIPFISIPLYFLKLRKTINSQAKLKLPPGPIKLPLIGNLHQLVPGNSLPHQSLGRLSNQYGPIMLLQLGSIPTLVVSSAEMAKEIFKTHDVVFSGRPVLYAAKKLSYNCAAVSFAPYGDYWREIRKIVMLELLNSKIVQSFHAVREEEVKDLVKTITISNSSSSSSSTYSFPIINISGLALSLANNVLCRVAFRKKFNGYDDHENGKSRLREMLHETQDLLGGFCMADYFPWMTWLNKFNGLEVRLDKCFRELDSFYDEVIEEHLDPERPPTEHKDVVDLLLRVQNDPNQAMKINNDQIKGVLTDIFIAGTDTTSATIVWIMAELIKNPAAMRRAQEEVREVAKGRGKVEECELSKLNYLKLVIKEGFRLHPPAPLLVPRETTEFCRVRGYDVPSGTRVFVNAREIGRDSKYWDNPDEFRPERFLESSDDYRGQHFELLPFGAGRRGCPGINFGVVLIELALANLLCSFDWVLPHGMRSEDLDMEEASGLTVHKKIPLCLVAKLVYP